MYFAFVIRLSSGTCWPYKVYDDQLPRALKRAQVYGKSLGQIEQIHKVGECSSDYEASVHLLERACRRAESLHARYSKQENTVDKQEKVDKP